MDDLFDPDLQTPARARWAAFRMPCQVLLMENSRNRDHDWMLEPAKIASRFCSRPVGGHDRHLKGRTRPLGFSASLLFCSRPLLEDHGIYSQASLMATQETVAEIRSSDVYEGPGPTWTQAPHPEWALRHLVSFALDCGKAHHFRVIDLMKFKMESWHTSTENLETSRVL